ncbi:MAG: hypothetical protein ACR2LC_03860 [Pyrinomonadaceae bacterium]
MPYKTVEEVRAYGRDYYQRNRERLLQKQAEKNRKFAEKRRQWLVAFKSRLKCVRCGESHPATLTFHHTNPSSKSFAIGDSTIALKISLKRLLAEIHKCEVLCANCHAKEHWSHLFEQADVAQG